MMERFDVNPERSDQVTASKWFNYSAQIVIIKHGKEGSIAYAKDGSSHRADSFQAQVVKTFGAGDSYAAGFLYGLMQHWSISDSMRYGSAAAAIVVSSHSCSDAMPTAQQVNEFIERSTAEV
jgi:5-dehydro-2-deoxygluconokinase